MGKQWAYLFFLSYSELSVWSPETAAFLKPSATCWPLEIDIKQLCVWTTTTAFTLTEF